MRPMLRRILVPAALLGACLARTSWADAQGVQWRGRAVDANGGAPVSAASVEVDGVRVALADSLGRFALAGLAPGRHRLRLSRLGYEPAEQRMSVAPGDTAEHLLRLTASPAEVGPVVAEARPVPVRMQGFEFRRTHRLGSGRFITRDELEKARDSTLPNVLRRLPGARIVHGGSAMEDYLASGNSAGPHALAHPPAPCYAQIYVDGVQVYVMEAGNDPPSLGQWTASDLEAIEYYSNPSSTPAQFRSMNSDCGTLVLWTRDGR